MAARLVLAAALLAAGPAAAQQAPRRAEPLRFWNLTTRTLTQLRLAPPGTGQWGANQCDNDDDKSVSPRERLRLAGITPGTYDVQVGDGRGLLCTVRGIELKAEGRYAFSLEDSQLTECEGR